MRIGRAALFAFTLTTAMTAPIHAEVYKCRSASGSISFSDRPCDGGPTAEERARDPRILQPQTGPTPSSSPPASATVPASRPASSPAAPSTSRQTPAAARVADSPESDRAMKESREQLLHERRRLREQTRLNTNKRCNDGDRQACKIAKCEPLLIKGFGTPDQFVACAQAQGFAYGSFWYINAPGKAHPPRFEDADLYRDLMRRNPPLDTTLSIPSEMVCFRKYQRGSEVEAEYRSVAQNVHAKVEGSQRKIWRTYAYIPRGSMAGHSLQNMQYDSLEKLADSLCGR